MPEYEQVVVELVEAFADPGVEHVVSAVVGLRGAIDVDECQLSGAEEGDLEELLVGAHHEGVAAGCTCPFEKEGGQMVLELEFAAVALQEEVERMVDAEAKGDLLTGGQREGLQRSPPASAVM